MKTYPATIAATIIIIGATWLATTINHALRRTKPTPAAESPWLFDDEHFIDTPIYTSVVEDIAATAAADIDAEWARLNGGAS